MTQLQISEQVERKILHIVIEIQHYQLCINAKSRFFFVGSLTPNIMESKLCTENNLQPAVKLSTPGFPSVSLNEHAEVQHQS